MLLHDHGDDDDDDGDDDDDDDDDDGDDDDDDDFKSDLIDVNWVTVGLQHQIASIAASPPELARLVYEYSCNIL